ncbi:MAG: 1-deoxy-D-xylulose-5-phosphate synthase [Oscillospiraceae bacterium]
MYLENINSPSDVKKLNSNELTALAAEMREALLKRASIHGGHFGPNFGMVEATIALHYVFNSPEDKIIFDVSHQSYPHKMLTGRKDAYLYPEKYDDVSGYTNPAESEHDFFEVGHTSTSVSLACGAAKARDLTGGKGNVIAVIGDGSVGGGEALEGLNTAGELDTNLIIIINDNDMSIAENHGGLYRNLKALRDGNGKAETNLFTAMGLDYIFVKDGNSIDELIKALKSVKDCKKAVAVHIVTQKGKGYEPAEKDKENWHWHMPFDIESGKDKFSFDGEDLQAMTADFLLEKMKKDPSVVALTAGTPTVMGFTKEKREAAGKQFVDVGIAEENAVAMSSALAKFGAKPVFGVFSPFLQRTYDQISHDVCINKSAATFVVFAASVWGMSDITHLGLYDIPMISNIPELVYLAPTCAEEYFAMLDWAIEQNEHPVAIRVPCNGVVHSKRSFPNDYSALNKSEVTQNGKEAAIIALGDFYQIGEQTAAILAEKGVNATLVNARFASGVDKALLDELKTNHNLVITLEDGSLEGGYGGKVAAYLGDTNIKVKNFGIEKAFYDRFDPNELLEKSEITPNKLADYILKNM